MKKYEQQELLLIWIDSFTNLDYNKKRDFYEKLIDTKSIKQSIIDNKEYFIELFSESVYNTVLNSANGEYFNYVLSRLKEKGITALTLDSEDYPEELLFIECPPLVLYAKGNIELLKEEKFAIVGSRKSLPLSIKLAENYTEKFVDSKIIPVTGIAEGIDEAVLKTALIKGGGCISVIAGGFDNVYPKSNANLLEEVIEKGLVLSEYPPEVSPMPYFFPIRNRILAGLGKGVLVVSGGMKSGTIYTAEYAMEYGKEVFAIPYSTNVESGAGCNDLIKRGARLTDTFNDIAEFYGYNLQEKLEPLTNEEKEIVNILSEGNIHVDKICSKLNKQIFEIMPVISVLEIKGVVVKSGFNTYSLITTKTEA